jgi:hypothetical protein
VEVGTTWYDDKTMEYHWVKPPGHTSEPTRYVEQKAIFDRYDVWLTQTFGPGGWWYDDANWVAANRKYYFKDEKDRMLFLLRFSE